MLSLIKYLYLNSKNEDVDEDEKNIVKEEVKKVVVSDAFLNENETQRQSQALGLCKMELKQVKEMEKLRKDFPDMFLSNHRNVLGLVVNKSEGTLTVDAAHKSFILDLAIVKTECEQEIGDRVYVRCYVESEELFNGEFVEILEPFAVIPANKKKRQKCSVKDLQDDFVALSNECFISKTVLKNSGDIHLNTGDAVYVDMIECTVKDFKWRCINFIPHKTVELADLARVPRNRCNLNKPRSVLPTPAGRWTTYQKRLCEYANQVWSQEIDEVIRGGSTTKSRRFRALRLPHYDVPRELRNVYLNFCATPNFCNAKIERIYPSLQKELTFDNYIDRFQALLWLEEIELFKNFREYDMERVEFNIESDCLSVTITDLGERRPSLTIGDKVHAFPLEKDKDKESASKCFEGVITAIQIDKILLKFNQMFFENYAGESYRLEFYFSRFNFRRMHYALFNAVQNLDKDFLFPAQITFNVRPQLDIRMDLEEGIMRTTDDTIKWHNPNLNRLQRSAVYNILRGEAVNMPYIIYGPPGTGKTITLVESILQLISNLPKSRLLVAAPSNSAANLICSRLIESKGLHMGEMIRIVSINFVERDQMPQDLLSYCATVDLGEDGTYEEDMYITEDGIQMNCPKRLLVNYRVTIGTCAVLGKYLELGFNPDHFTHVLIDEAGQCTEPTIMVPVSQVAKNRGQVILAGDPMQLQAVVVNKYAMENGLSLSFLERIMNTKPYIKDSFDFEELSGYNPIIITKLCQNYRSLPSILRIYNYLFYDLELRSTINTTDSAEVQLLKKLDKKVLFPSDDRPPAHGAFFYAVRGENMREKDSPSWCNPREANVVFSTTISLYRNGVQPEDIGIITPYVKQVKLIRSLFAQAKLMNPKIGSVEEFQGQERNIILLSTVRTTKREVLKYDFRFGLGFVKSERRLNVAISRARALLIVFGDPALLELDDCWGIYVGDCRHNDSFFGSKEDTQNESNDEYADAEDGETSFQSY